MSKVVIPGGFKLEMEVGFHPDGVCCDGCRFCRTDTTNRDRKRCAITEEILWDTHSMGMLCPLVQIEEKE